MKTCQSLIVGTQTLEWHRAVVLERAYPDAVNLGDRDGFGTYGTVDEDADGLLCHECGHRFAHLGLHAWRGHGMTAAIYREAHGLARSRGLVAAETRSTIVDNARRNLTNRPQFVEARDPAAATAARLANGSGLSPAGLAASRSRPGRGRRGTVVTCGWCEVRFCPLTSARRRRFCSRSCAARWTRSKDRPTR